MRRRTHPPRRRRQLKTILVLPTLITTGNLLAGFIALTHLLVAGGVATEAEREGLWVRAAWMIFLGMFCDAMDGRIARLTKSTSAFGAQLDSLADVVTFGVVPALLARAVLAATFPNAEPRLLTAIVVLYVVGAALRLARYNVESARVSNESAGHVTLVFRGLPSPAAAGMVASLVLLHHEYRVTNVDWVILSLTPVLGLLMISRLPYPHVLNRFFEGRRPLPAVGLLVIAVFLFFIYFHETITAMFFLYAASGPLLLLSATVTGRPRWVLSEDQDEADALDDESNGTEAGAEAEQERTTSGGPFGRG